MEGTKKMKNNVRRALKFHKKDGTFETLEISRATKLKNDAGMFHLDKFKDGTYRLMWSKDVLDEFADITNIEIIRER